MHPRPAKGIASCRRDAGARTAHATVCFGEIANVVPDRQADHKPAHGQFRAGVQRVGDAIGRISAMP